MSQIGSVYQNKLRMQSSNTLPLKQKSEILYNTNHSTYTVEYQEAFHEDKKLPKKDSIGTVEENIVEQQQHREQQTTVDNLKWYKKLSSCCNLSVLKQHIRNSLTNVPTPKSLCILHKLHHSHFDRPIGHSSLNKCVQLHACRNCNFKHSLIFITFFSILLNLPLFFVQKVVRKNIPHNNLYYRIRRRRSSSTLFCNPTKRLISIDNTDLSSEAVSAPVDLCTSSKWKNKDYLQLNEMKNDLLSTTIHHSPQCINKIKIIKSENTTDYIKMNYSSVPAINETPNYLVISNPFNTDNNLLYKPIETQFQQSSLITKNNDPFINSLQPTNCQTEIKYDLNNPSCIYKTFRAYYSHDSVIKNWIFQLTNNNNDNNNNNQNSQNTKQITSQSHSIYSNRLLTNKHCLNNNLHEQCIQNYNKRKEDTINNVKQNIIHCVNLNMLHNNNNEDYCNKSNDNISNSTISSTSKNSTSVITNSKTCTHSIIDSDSHGVGLTFSHVYCPLIYRESDFDVISVDESNAQDEPEPNSFL